MMGVLDVVWPKTNRDFARAWVVLFNAHVHDCRIGCSTDPEDLRLCSYGEWLNDQASDAAALALLEEATR